MAQHQPRDGSTFDPTFALATGRMQALLQEAHGERLAGQSTAAAAPSQSRFRFRLGTALIALGSQLAPPAETRRPSFTD